MATMEKLLVHLFLVGACLTIIIAQPAHARKQQKVFGPNSIERRLAVATARFGLDFLKNLEANKNVIFSPLSLQIASSMALLGAGKKSSTEQQLAKVLGYEFTDLLANNGSENALAHQAMLSLTQSLVALNGQSDDRDLSLKIANLILSEKDQVKLKHSYKAAVTSYYDVKLEQFSAKGSKAPLVKRINSWVKKNTGNKIDRLVNEEDLKRAVILLLNAAHFKSSWFNQFDPTATYESDFFNHGSESEKRKVKFMYQTEQFSYIDLKPDEESCSKKADSAACKLDCQVVSMPFKANLGSELSMVFLLPHKRNGIADLQAKLDGSTLNALYKAFDSSQQVRVRLPKFNFELKVEAKDILEKMGLIDIFSNKANFEQMVESKERLFVSKVIHKAMVAVDESGAEAAAVTMIDGQVGYMPSKREAPVFLADHPFLFVIRHDKSDMPLFMGRVDELK